MQHICNFGPALTTNYELQNKRKTHKQNLKNFLSISGKSETLISIANGMFAVFATSEWSCPFSGK